MAIGDFDTFYSDNPWEVIDKNQRTWYDPELIAMFREQALFTPTINFVKNLGDVRATKMVLNSMYDPHPDTTALALRQIWMPASHIDSRQVEIVFNRYGGKVAYTVYDDIITYWRQNGRAGLRQIMRGALGQHMVDVLDLLARNAYLQGAYDSGYMLFEGGGNDFSDIGDDDTFDLATGLDIWLGMTMRRVASARGPSGAADNIICYTTPGIIYDIQKGTSSDEWISINQYANATKLLRYEVGTYKNIRFVQSPKLVLWNCGAIAEQKAITAAATAGDGAPDPNSSKVDGTYMVGQTTDGITNYIQLDGFSDGDYAANDMVTIHQTRTSAYGVSNGVNPFEGTSQVRRVISADHSTNRITVDRPLMVDLATDLGGGAYGWVTKGRNIHASIFVGGPQGIVSGVALPPRLHVPPPVDDFLMVQRFSWDAYIGHQVYAPEVFEVVLSAGSTRVKGDVRKTA